MALIFQWIYLIAVGAFLREIKRSADCIEQAGLAIRFSRIRSNFFPPEARWQFSGIRLARGAG